MSFEYCPSCGGIMPCSPRFLEQCPDSLSCPYDDCIKEAHAGLDVLIGQATTRGTKLKIESILKSTWIKYLDAKNYKMPSIIVFENPNPNPNATSRFTYNYTWGEDIW